MTERCNRGGLRESLFLTHLPATLEIILPGMAPTIAVGLLLAILIDMPPAADAMLYPTRMVIQTIPAMRSTPLFVLWSGCSLWARLLNIVLSRFFSITINAFESASKKPADHSVCRQTVKKLRVASEGSQALRLYIENRRHVRRFSCDFACKIASLHEQTTGRAIYGSTSARVHSLEKVPSALFRHAAGRP